MSHVSLKDVATNVGVTFLAANKVLKELSIVVGNIDQVRGNHTCHLHALHVFSSLTIIPMPLCEFREVVLRLLHDFMEATSRSLIGVDPLHTISGASTSVGGSVIQCCSIGGVISSSNWLLYRM